MITAVEALTAVVSTTQACAALGVARSTLYRSRQPLRVSPPAPRGVPGSALSDKERAAVRALLNSERFVDCSPRQVYGTLLDEGQYVCHWRTMYRILAEHEEVRERRRQRQHPSYTKPELLATAPNQLWSWDISKLRGPFKWTYFYLYVILDVFSRYVVGWLIAERELSRLAEVLIAESCHKEGIQPQQLTLHADRGSAMTAKPVACLLADLGVTQSHSRPYTSDDNPFSEAQFKTMKYRPDYPDRFGALADARAWACSFFDWYNHHHRHSRIGLMTPATVHYGLAEQLTAERQVVLTAAFQRHPQRFVKGQPTPPQLPGAVWINPPKPSDTGLSLS